MSELVLCFLSTRAHARGPWIYVYRDGRVEKREGPRGFLQRLRHFVSLSNERQPIVLSHAQVPTARVEEALALALRVLGHARPRIDEAAHDPTQELTLEILDSGAWKKGWFTWGRASGNDAPLSPVVGDAENREFEVLMRLLWDMQVASIGG